MTDFISRSDLHHIAEDLRRNSPKDNDTYFVACEVLDYAADKMPEPKPAKPFKDTFGRDCCSHCGSFAAIYSTKWEENRYCGNCGWPIDWGY